MKKITFLVTFLFVILTTGAAVSAQAPDPTGRGRYFVLGGERAVVGAEMATSLPAGTSCAPAGELSGGKFFNSTGSGRANIVELTSRATVAVTPDGKQFLCKCGASGKFFNRIFPVEEEPEAETPQPVVRQEVVKAPYQEQKQEQKAEAAATASVVIESSCMFQTIPNENGGTDTYWVCPKEQPVLFSSTKAPAPKKGWSTTKKVVVGSAVAGGTITALACIFKWGGLCRGGKIPPIVQTLPVGPLVTTR